ncbi:hypothetical protein N8I77_002950 [Diaporthe amygdali]|uniref:SIMPL domain-containing protein n=1 Tax=Phomopsis amygdali TaxID=1214568 RepID=A0AAD9SI87_PHOAM|nr:hypothetical protein N8I77_002950 [Diaporthe amygdali]
MLPQLKIHVNGSASVFRTAERGVLHIEISSTTTTQGEASSNVSSTTETVINTFRHFAPKTEDGLYPHASAGITAFSASAPETSTFIPRDKNGREIKSAPKEYTSTTTAEVIFRDMELLARLATELSAMENVSITQTEWRLTDATHIAICREARVKAMKDAVQKAEDYAGVVGREVVAIKVEDGPANVAHSGPIKQTARRWGPSQLAQAPPPTQAARAAARMDQGLTIQGPALEPSTITVSARVDVRFVSKDGEPVENDSIGQGDEEDMSD